MIIAVGCLVLLPNLGASSLWDFDEALWGSTTAEMARRGDWIVPWHNEEVSTHKPPLMFWVMLVGTRLCGETEFGFRIGSAMCGILTALVVRHLGCLLFCRDVGLLAGIITVTALNLVLIARAANPDIQLTLLAAGALLIFVRSGAAAWPSRGRFRPLPWAVATGMYAVLGLAVLTKGPLGVAIPAAALGLFVWWHNLEAAGASLAGRSLGGRLVAVVREGMEAARSLRPLLGIAVVLLVAGPWFVLVQQRSGGAFATEFIGIHHVQRFFEPMEGHRGPFYYYLPALLIGMFPWSMFAIPTVLDTARRLRGSQPDRAAAMLLTAWLATWIIVFSLARTKLPNYILPAYPAAALLVAAFLVAWIRQPAVVGRRWMPIAMWLLLGVAAAAAVGCLAAPAIRIGGRAFLDAVKAAPAVADVLRLAAWSGAIMAAGAAACLILSARDRRGAAVTAFSIMAVGLALFLFGIVAVAAGRHHPTRELVRIMQEHGATPATPFGQCSFTQPSLVLYGGRRVERCSDAAGSVEFFRAHPDGMLVIRVRDAAELAAVQPPGTDIIGQVADFPKHAMLFVVRRAEVDP